MLTCLFCSVCYVCVCCVKDVNQVPEVYQHQKLLFAFPRVQFLEVGKHFLMSHNVMIRSNCLKASGLK